jgi:hypothetical protein
MTRGLWMAILVAVAAAGCEQKPREHVSPLPQWSAPPRPVAPIPELEPSRITVQHVLIAFKGAFKAPPNVTRTRGEAATFAREILERVRKGEDIARLAKLFSTDPGGGRYTLVNTGVTAGPGEIPRGKFIKPFVDVAFKLKVGEAGLVEYDEKTASFGWHIIKRLE